MAERTNGISEEAVCALKPKVRVRINPRNGEITAMGENFARTVSLFPQAFVNVLRSGKHTARIEDDALVMVRHLAGQLEELLKLGGYEVGAREELS